MSKINLLILFVLIIYPYQRLSCEWKQVHYLKNQAVQSINCLDSNNCYAIIQHATKEDYGMRIYTSSNGGRLWELINTTKHESPYILNVNEGVSPYPGYYFILSDDETFLEKSIDGGKTFKTIVLDPDNHYTNNIRMYDTSIGIAINSNVIYTTTDGWETFERHPKKNNLETFYSPKFIDSNTIIMAYSSSDNPNGMAVVKYHLKENNLDTLSYLGFNSGEDQTANDFNRIYCLYFVNDSLGFGGGSSRVHQGEKEYFDMIYRTTDSGYTWKTVFRGLNYPEVGFDNNIAFADEKNGIAVGHYGKIAMTNDGGETWVYEPTPNDMDNCRKMLVCWAGQTPLIGTWDGGIFRYEGDFFDFPISVEDEPEERGISVCPNPASEYIEINVGAIHELSLQEIRIYNIYGECSLTPCPVETVGANGRSPVRVDISYLSSGIYFVRIGEFVAKFVKY
jgi:hypothetical protein